MKKGLAGQPGDRVKWVVLHKMLVLVIRISNILPANSIKLLITLKHSC
jgi:hypothetical protein